MSKLKNYENLVIEIMYDHPETRDSDRILYLKVLEYMGFNTLVTLDHFLTSNSYPNFESIGRMRRRIQEKNPDLRATGVVQEGRKEMEEEFLQYVRS